MVPDLIGINQDKIDQFVLDSYDYIEKINSILNNITNEIVKTTEYFDCEAGNDFRKKYLEQKESFSNLSSKLMAYSEKLVDVKNKTLNNSSELAAQIRSASKDVEIVLPKK